MAEPIIYVVICMIVSMIFVILGIYQYRAKDPVTINTGETPPKAEDLIDVKLWNQKHGRNFIILGIMLWCTFVVGGYVLSRINGVIAAIITIVAVIVEFFWIDFQHKKMKREYIK